MLRAGIERGHSWMLAFTAEPPGGVVGRIQQNRWEVLTVITPVTYPHSATPFPFTSKPGFYLLSAYPRLWQKEYAGYI